MRSLRLDSRIGSKHLAAPLRRCGVPVKLCRLPFGDAALTVRVGARRLKKTTSGVALGAPSGAAAEQKADGPRALRIGVELKRAADLFSSLSSKRFVGHQLPGLISHYDIRWLIVEGDISPTRDRADYFGNGATRKELLAAERGWRYDVLLKHLITFCIRGGIRLWHTRNGHETALFLAALFSWGRKKIEDHTSHLGFEEFIDPQLRRAPSLRWLWAKELPGLGRIKAKRAANHFCCAYHMATAKEEEWRKVKGVGKKLASSIQKALWVSRRGCSLSNSAKSARKKS